MEALKLSKKVTSEKGGYILIAVIGFVSSIVTLFIDVNETISIKWIILLVCIFATFTIIFIRIIIAIASAKRIDASINIVKYYQDREVFLIKTNVPIPINALLSIYIQMDDYEDLYALGYVENVQENKLVSVKVIKKFIDEPQPQDLLEKSVVKTSLPYNRLRLEE